MGKEGKYDLKLAEPPPPAQPPTEDSDTEDDTGLFTKKYLQNIILVPFNTKIHSSTFKLSCIRTLFTVTEAELMEKSSHPTAMMLTSTVNLLKTLSLSSGIYAEVLQTDATRTLCGLLRMLVESGANDKGKAATVININLSFLKQDFM